MSLYELRGSWSERDFQRCRNVVLVPGPNHREIPGFVLHLAGHANSRRNPPIRSDSGVGQCSAAGNKLLANLLMPEIELNAVARREPVIAPGLGTLALSAYPTAD